jgi:citrate synthase
MSEETKKAASENKVENAVAAEPSIGAGKGEEPKKMSEETKKAAPKGGLEDVVAGESAICLVDGKEGRLLYRGYDIRELADQSSFEEVAYLLWYGRLPGKVEYEAFLSGYTGSMELPVESVMILRMFPQTATPMEVLRTAVSSLGHWDPDSGNTLMDASLRKAIRLSERISQLISAHYRLRIGKEPLPPRPGQTIAYNFLYQLYGKDPNPEWVNAFDVALILHADHEWNASTFAARVVAATMSDMYSSVVAGIGALKGPLHGGANEQVMKMLHEIGEPEKAEQWVKNALANKVKIPGFGHRVYRTEDPRATILREYAAKLSHSSGNDKIYAIACEVEKTMLTNSKVYPNVDFYSGICYEAMGIPPELFTPIFAMSRITGWTAHILEQWQHNRLIRPRAEYIGPMDLKYTPINRR